uniref:ATP-grasp domain-containing protein n=1 Tax=Streptomyces sp. NBC_00008 TaxID=2903610 RepID=A0AAU2VLL8_9ACTN
MTTDASTAPGLLLVGGAGPAPLGIDVAVAAIEQARSRGLRVHLMGHGPDLAATEEACRLADTVSAVDFEDPGAAVAWAVERKAAGERFDVVFTCRELALPATARIAAALGARGNPPAVIDLVRNKDRCRARLAEAGHPQPASRLCHGVEDAERAVADSSAGPWVVKPRVGGGSEGVRLVTDATQVAQAVAGLPAESGEEFLVEDFVVGDEYSVEGLFHDGEPQVLAITAKEKMPPPYFVEAGHRLPASISAEAAAGIERAVTAALREVGLIFGLFHVELWLTDQGVVLGELHARLGGDYIHRMLAHALDGLEMFGEVYDDALGRLRAPGPRTCRRAGASRYFTPPPGRLAAVEGWREAAAHSAVLAAELNVAPGDMIGTPRDSDGRVGGLTVGAGTAEEAEQLAAALARSVRFTVESGAPRDGT